MRNDLHWVLLSSIKWNSYNIKGLGLLCHLVSSMDTYTLQARPKPQMTNTTTRAKREIAYVVGWRTWLYSCEMNYALTLIQCSRECTR